MSVSLMPHVVPSPAFSRYSLAVGPCSRHPVTSVGVLDAECDAGAPYSANVPSVQKSMADVIHKLMVVFITNLLGVHLQCVEPRALGLFGFIHAKQSSGLVHRCRAGSAYGLRSHTACSRCVSWLEPEVGTTV